MKLILLTILFEIFLYKNLVTYRNFKRVLDAIETYYCSIGGDVNTRLEIYEMLNRLTPYRRILFNPFDWGYLHILPKEDLERIQPYIF